MAKITDVRHALIGGNQPAGQPTHMLDEVWAGIVAANPAMQEMTDQALLDCRTLFMAGSGSVLALLETADQYPPNMRYALMQQLCGKLRDEQQRYQAEKALFLDELERDAGDVDGIH